MTPEQAQYYLLMLRLGEYDAYDRELDRILEEEDVLSDLVLELAFCMSDRGKTISVLHNYLLTHPADKQGLMEDQRNWVREQYRNKAMTALRAAEYLWKLIRILDCEEASFWLYRYIYDYELYDEGLISLGVFEQCFEARILRDEDPDPWKLQAEQTRKQSAFGKFRDWLNR